MIRKLLVKPPDTTSEIQTMATTVEVYNTRISTDEARFLRHGASWNKTSIHNSWNLTIGSPVTVTPETELQSQDTMTD
jgi:hypothetical protein